MRHTKRIPVIKSRVVVTKPRKRSKLFLITTFVTALALLLFQVWLRVHTNNVKTDIQEIKDEIQEIVQENNTLNAKVTELANYGRIHEIAEDQLGLVFVRDADNIPIE